MLFFYIICVCVHVCVHVQTEEFGQEATEEQMGEAMVDPEGEAYDENQQVGR